VNDTRALTWMSLFPSDAAYSTLGGPDWFRDLLASARTGGGRPVLVAWDMCPSSFPDLAGYSGIVAINCHGMSARALADTGFAYVRRFAVVPRVEAARWFIPLEGRTIASAAFQLYAPFQPTARLKHLGVRAAARSGLPFWYRDQIWIAQREASPLERLLQGLAPSEAIRLAISSGTPGPARKPTAALLTANGRIVGYAKLACSDVSSRLVRHEAVVLQVLASRSAQPPLAPQLVIAGECEGFPVTVQTALPGHPPSRRLSTAHRRFLDGLSVDARRPAGDAGIIRSLRERIASLVLARPHLLAALDAATVALDGASLPTTIVHGDLAPWNLRAHDGEIAAFDWEYADVDGLPLLDEVQHVVQVGFFLEDRTADQVHHRLQELAVGAPLRLRPEQIRALQVISLLGILVRTLQRLDKGYTSHRWFVGRCQHLLGLLSPPLRAAAA